MADLTAKQAKFVEEYLIDLNATQAAIRSGYSASTAYSIGSENLSKPEIQEALAERRTLLSLQSGITPERVIEELARIGFSDMRNYATWGPSGVSLLSSDEMSPDVARCVAEVAESITKGGGSIRFKLHDKVAALDRIGKHLGMFVDKLEIEYRDLTPEQREQRVLHLLSAAEARKSA